MLLVLFSLRFRPLLPFAFASPTQRCDLPFPIPTGAFFGVIRLSLLFFLGFFSCLRFFPKTAFGVLSFQDLLLLYGKTRLHRAHFTLDVSSSGLALGAHYVHRFVTPPGPSPLCLFPSSAFPSCRLPPHLTWKLDDIISPPPPPI